VRKFVVGLVGKPSAGKSTFFNCVTRLQVEAKVGAHPFTTIEPNFGSGWWVPLDDAEDRGEFASRHGRDARGRRLLPLLVKDVAGLIPGAYKGLGKGNRFLNDLCDADVLIHVVDVSGSADRNGVAVGVGDPAASSPRDDVKWVREELHRWVFGNVAAKWRSVVRYAKHSERMAAERVHALFSGYRGAHSALSAAAVRAKLDLDKPQTWSRFDLHRVVAHFLSVRFPMTLALNKADKLVLGDGGEVAAQAAIEAARALAGDQGYAAVPCSAATETALLGLARAGAVAYELGESRPAEKDRTALLAHFGGDAAQAARRLDAFARVIAALGGTTGVLDCVSRAVALRRPLLVFPVADVRSGLPVGPAASVAAGNTGFAPGAFRDCLQVLPGSTVEDVYTALRRNELDMFSLDGDFVRAECGSMAGLQVVRQVGKDAVLDRSTRVVKILCNKKPVWQQAHARQVAASANTATQGTQGAGANAKE
jgi:ribosome-binding ATPase YchF (GTP1/OBG family)